MTVAFTGHRPKDIGGYKPCKLHVLIREAIRFHLDDLMPKKVISGMALGVDQWAAEIAIELSIPFIAAIPCDGQDSTWPEESKNHYQKLLSKASKSIVISPGPYTAWKMSRRNEWMVDMCDILIAVWNGNPGGTANCVNYAIMEGFREWGTPRKIIRINPREL